MPHDQPHTFDPFRVGTIFKDVSGKTWEIEQWIDGGKNAICHRVTVPCNGISPAYGQTAAERLGYNQTFTQDDIRTYLA